MHDMPKVGIVGYQLPVDVETAGIIRAQQARLRDRYPDTPASAAGPVPNPRT